MENEGHLKFVEEHRKGCIIAAVAFAVFFGCSNFPIVNLSNLSREFSNISVMNAIIGLGAYVYIGKMFKAVFGDKKLPITILYVILSTAVGFVCRYLLEFGEVSNTYNFTPENILLHLAIVLFVTTLS